MAQRLPNYHYHASSALPDSLPATPAQMFDPDPYFLHYLHVYT